MNSRPTDPDLRLSRFALLRGHVAEPGHLEHLEPRLLMAADAGPLAWAQADGGNDHTYEVVLEANGISWEDARVAAEQRGGYLVTITSQAENDFVFGLVNDPSLWFQLPVLGVQAHGPWIGASRPLDATGTAGEDWQWVTGEAFSYSNWAANEPDRTSEHYALFAASGQQIDSVWKNWNNDHSRLKVISYVVEYEAVEPENTAPEFTSAPVTEATEAQVYTYQLSADDADGDPLAFAAVNLPDWLALEDNGDGTAILRGTPLGEHAGAVDVVVSVSDGTDEVEQAFTIEVAAAAATTSSIAGVVWADVNGDGVRDDGEAALAGWNVYLDANDNGLRDEGEVTVVTADDGSYQFEDLEPGDHVVRAEAPVDEGLLDRFQLSFRRWRWRGNVLLSDSDAFQRTDLDSRSFLLKFEIGNDDRFDDLELKVSFADNGAATLDVVSRGRWGRYHLLDANGRKMARKLGTSRWSTQSVQLHGGWNASVSTESTQRVTTEAGDEADDVDLGLTENPVEPAEPHRPSWSLENVIRHVLSFFNRWAWRFGH